MSTANTSPQPAILQFAFFPRGWWAHLQALADKAERENWKGNGQPNAILGRYIQYMFDRLSMEKKIFTTRDKKWAAFNTGLLDSNGNDIFAFFQKHNSPKVPNQDWFFKGWVDESDSLFMTQIPRPLPEMADFVNPPQNLVYDMAKELCLSTSHILERKERFPRHLQQDRVRADQALQSAKTMALKRLRRNYKIAIPQWYPASSGLDVQLLLPLDLDRTGTADLALVVERVGTAYRGNTVLTLDMAYSNARLVARPDSEWLKPN